MSADALSRPLHTVLCAARKRFIRACRLDARVLPAERVKVRGDALDKDDLL